MNPCLYLKGESDYLALIVIYVVDILILSCNSEEIQRIGTELRKKFEMKDLGDPNCLGMNSRQDDEGIWISQATYVREILTCFGITGVHAA